MAHSEHPDHTGNEVGIDAILHQIEGSLFDIELDENGDIKSEDFFDTSILVSLFCDRRASPEEMAPSYLRRGWIGDEFTPGFQIGSLLWLYEQPRYANNIFRAMEIAVQQALHWMVDKGYAVSVKALIEPTNTYDSISLTINFVRPSSEVEQRHFILWDNTGKQ